MKIKHIAMLALVWILAMQASAQQVKWMNPMDGDEPYICGRAWNKEIGKSYQRLPNRFEATMPKNVWKLQSQSAGLIVRFVSNSKNIRVRYGCPDGNYNAFNMSGIDKSGVDLYGKNPDGDIHWVATHMKWKLKPDTAMMEWTNLTLKNKNRGAEYTLYLPNYNSIKWLEVGVDSSASFQFVHESPERPIVVYGSSIIQGASPSRPGMAITNIIEREMEYPIINLGFSGSARMEPAVFDMLSEIDARAYVIDAMPNSFNLKDPDIIKRAKEGVMKLRAAKGDVPILLCECHPTPDSVFRANIAAKYNRGNAALRKAYNELKAEGVKNLYYMSKDEIAFTEDYMIEGSHPNDLGCRAYADIYEQKLREMLSEDKPNKVFPPVTQRRDGCYEWRVRHNQVVELNHTTDPEILLIGNSITHFWGGNPVNGVNNGGAAWGKTFGKRRVTNMGFGWDRIENVFWRIYHGELEGCTPKHICLLIGINNYYTNTEEEIAQGIVDLAALIRERQPQAKIHVLKVYPAKGREEKVARINSLLEKKFVADDKTELVDLTQCLLLQDGSGKVDLSCFKNDGLHPNEKGYTLLGKQLKKHLK